MLRKNPRGDYPEVHETAFVDPTAILCGRVIIHEGVFIGPYAVIRADETDEQGHLEPIIIRAYSENFWASRVSSTRALVSLAAASNARGESAWVPRSITVSRLS